MLLRLKSKGAFGAPDFPKLLPTPLVWKASFSVGACAGLGLGLSCAGGRAGPGLGLGVSLAWAGLRHGSRSVGPRYWSAWRGVR